MDADFGERTVWTPRFCLRVGRAHALGTQRLRCGSLSSQIYLASGNKVDLRIEGIAQDVILEDEERMGQIQKVLEKVRTGSRTKSISEESSRTIHEIGSIELHE